MQLRYKHKYLCWRYILHPCHFQLPTLTAPNRGDKDSMCENGCIFPWISPKHVVTNCGRVQIKLLPLWKAIKVTRLKRRLRGFQESTICWSYAWYPNKRMYISSSVLLCNATSLFKHKLATRFFCRSAHDTVQMGRTSKLPNGSCGRGAFTRVACSGGGFNRRAHVTSAGNLV